VWVDDVEHAYGRLKMCHLWADTLDELLDMVDTIGVQRKWLQRPDACVTGEDLRYKPDTRYLIGMNASWVHFDIAKSKKVLAIAAGAILTDRLGPLRHTAWLAIQTGQPNLVKYGRAKLRAYNRLDLNQ
jgi:hypothetical protein